MLVRLRACANGCGRDCSGVRAHARVSGRVRERGVPGGRGCGRGCSVRRVHVCVLGVAPACVRVHARAGGCDRGYNLDRGRDRAQRPSPAW